MDNSVLLVVSRLSSYSSSSLSSTSRSTGQFNHSRKLRTLSDTVTTRSDKHACGKPMLTDHDKQATVNHEPANEMNTEDPTQGILVWFQPSTVNLEDLETHVPAHPSEREGDASKVETQKRKHSIYTHFPKDRNCDICLRTKITMGSLQYAGVVQDLATQWIRSYPCKTKTSQETREFTTASRAVRKAIRIRQILWRIIMESSNVYTSSIRDERNCRTSCTSSKRRDISRIIAIRIGWWVVVGFYGMLLLFAKCPRLLGGRENSKWTKIWWIIERTNYFIWCTVGCLQTPRERERDKARNHEFGKKVLPGIFPGFALIAGEFWEEDVLIVDIEELGQLDAS